MSAPNCVFSWSTTVLAMEAALTATFGPAMFSPDLSVMRLPATMSIFLPHILMSPLGALMLMPVRASMETSPKAEAMVTLRLWVQ